MKTFAFVLCGLAVVALVGEGSYAEPHRDVHADLASTRSGASDFANLALSLATTSNLTGLHALLIERLLNHSNSSSEDLTEQLQPVVAVVNDTLEPNVVRDKYLAQQTISSFEALFLHCEELAATAFNQSLSDQAAVTDRRLDHSSCRNQESALSSATVNCQTMAAAAETVRAYKCELYSQSDTIPSSSCFPIGGENAEAFHIRKLEFFEKSLADLLQKQDDCNRSTASAASQLERCDAQRTSLLQTKSSCDTKQRILDSSICQLKKKMESDCAQSSICQQQALASYKLANDSVQVDEASLKKTWEQLQQIRCMVKAVQERRASSAADACSSAAYSVDHLSVEYVAVPPFSPCQQIAETMGSPEYMRTLYGSLPTNVQIQACTSQCCNEATANDSAVNSSG